MPLADYQDRVDRLRRALARAWRRDPALLNIPGRSVACKIDPNYYLALQPAFDTALGRAAGMLPRSAAEALVRCGLFITSAPGREHVLPVEVFWGGHGGARGGARGGVVSASFLDAEFVDRALLLHGGAASGLPVADLRLGPGSREAVARLFEHKTPPARAAFLPA